MNSNLFYKDQEIPLIECRYTQDSSNHYKPHMHNTFSIGAIDSAKVEYKVAGDKEILEPGSIAIINPQTLHSCNPLQQIKRSYYMLYLDIRWCLEIQKSIFGVDSFINSPTIILKDMKIYKEFIKSINFFIRDNYPLEKEQKIASLLEKIFIKTISKERKNISISHDYIEKVKEILSLNLDQAISLDDISKKLEINPYTLLRKFKKETGIAPHNFRMNIRIEHSKMLLQNKTNISKVALDCGFYDQNHFQKYFKASTTVTPREYQQNFLIKQKI